VHIRLSDRQAIAIQKAITNLDTIPSDRDDSFYVLHSRSIRPFHYDDFADGWRMMPVSPRIG
jgi:hypothetical protein